MIPLGMKARHAVADEVRRRWLLVAAALLVIVAAVFLATPRAAMLVGLVGWHATVILLPVIGFVFVALRAGIRDLTLVGLLGLTGGAVAVYALFWLWRASPTAGALASIAAIAASAAAIAWLVRRVDRPALALASPLGIAALLWIAYGLFVLAYGLAPSGFEEPLVAVRARFGHSFPVDNMLPWTFAQHIAAEKALLPVSGDWLASDRPPLQTAYFLASLGPLLPRADLHYQVQSSLLQALWVPGMWLLLRGFELKRGAAFLVLATGMFSGLALTHGLYTWPKLLPVAYLAATAAVLLNSRRESLSDPRVGGATGACFGAAMLCHPGSAFVLAGLAVVLPVLRRVPRVRFVVPAAAATLALMLPWMLYQKYVDPPGNRLAKWHLAGVVAVDSRSFAQAVGEAYAALTPGELVANKVENVRALFGPADSAALVLKGSTVGVEGTEFVRLLSAHFLYMFPAMGMLALAPLAWLVPRAWHKPEFAASIRLSGVALSTLAAWVLLVFIPGQTLVHIGSLAVPCFLLAAAMLALYAASPWLALVGFGLHLALTLELYARVKPLAAATSLADYRAFNLVALVALGATCALLWKTSSMNPRSPLPP